MVWAICPNQFLINDFEKLITMASIRKNYKKVQDQSGRKSTTVAWEHKGKDVRVEYLGRDDNPFERGKSWTLRITKDGEVVRETDSPDRDSVDREAKSWMRNNPNP